MTQEQARDDRAASLLRTIEAEIIPRLMLAHRGPSNDDRCPAEPPPRVGAEQVEELTRIILRRDPAGAQAYVRARHGSGLALQTIYLELLAPVARRLGEMWSDDSCDFTQVTVALWRLQQIVYEHSPAFQRDRRHRFSGRRALLVPAPGSQHTFGVVMVAEFFRRAGWDVWGDPTATEADIAGALASECFDVLGLSVGSECMVTSVSSAILSFRKVSRNPSIVVMVGGPVVPLLHDFVSRVGADGTAPDAATAVALAERLVAQRAASP
ncbi:cobalamin-dependent protein [Ideonella sp. DXS29W]|uniref:Cobalamin-dependent protein n=1 Tax=Ideonella lacteola TaxID=2984193 RepID=A0ABU9BRL9_9BURK